MEAEKKIESQGTKIRRKLSIISKTVLFWNWLAILGILVSYLSKHISPETFWFLAFFGLAYPVLLILNILFIIYWILRWRWQVIYSLVAIIIGWGNVRAYVQLNHKTLPLEEINGIKVLSHNVRLFDLYNWSHNKETRKKIFDFFKEENPDILCLQEFYNSEDKEYHNVDSLKNILKTENYHTEYTITLRDSDHWGVATFTRYQIVNKGKITFDTPSNNICIYTDMIINNDTVRVYNLHLQSIHFGYADYKYIKQIQEDKERFEVLQTENILKRLRLGFIRRAIQTEMVVKHISECPYPMIVCGDFNDTPCSYTYNEFESFLKDAFKESGFGFAKTYIGDVPSFRIDYIFHTDSFSSYDYETLPDEFSDHHPISTILVKNK